MAGMRDTEAVELTSNNALQHRTFSPANQAATLPQTSSLRFEPTLPPLSALQTRLSSP